ncbi:MAG: GIY-YIG nuclease family protein [Parcubacteria group bacterium]
MYTTYILKSQKNKKHYIGHTEDLEERLRRHNAGFVKSTKNGIPWEVIYTENYPTKSLAYKRELEIKSYKGGIKFKKLLGLWKD